MRMVSLEQAAQWLGKYPEHLEKELDGIELVDGVKSISQELLDRLVADQDREYERRLESLAKRYDEQLAHAQALGEWVDIADHLALRTKHMSNVTPESLDSMTARIIRQAEAGKIEHKQNADGTVLIARDFTISMLEPMRHSHLSHVNREWDQIKKMRADKPFYELSERAKEVLPDGLQARLLSAARYAHVSGDGTSMVVALHEAKKYLAPEELFDADD